MEIPKPPQTPLIATSPTPTKPSAIVLTALITFGITSVLVGTTVYVLLDKTPTPEATVPPITPSTIPTIEAIPPIEQTSRKNPDPHSSPTKGVNISLSSTKRFSSDDPKIASISRPGKDIIVIDLALEASAECEQGCSTGYIHGYQRDYHLSTASGSVAEIGTAEYTGIITDPDQFVVMFAGQKMKRQAYFYVNSTDHDFIFRYIGAAFTPTQQTYAFSI